MKNYVKWMDKQSKLVKAIFCIPGISFLWIFYRIFKSALAKNFLGVVIGILLLFVFWGLWLVDLITIILTDKVIWF